MPAVDRAVQRAGKAAINKWLAHLRTPFKLSKLNYCYVGGPTPRTEYGVLVRDKHVAAGKAATNAPSFSTVLLDGDKRSLALAFFLAKVLHEKNCAESIVVLDDVFASLDSNRRSQTIGALCEVAKKMRSGHRSGTRCVFPSRAWEGHGQGEGFGATCPADSPCGRVL
ncbi:hypothetical protein ACSFBX_11240 [Variovorax sp. RB2P76]|uniref:hypothetical protein n=1 Tax=Variovorax sp. RB2P76 TaxID=3443736 RepID=UPI003F44D35A